METIIFAIVSAFLSVLVHGISTSRHQVHLSRKNAVSCQLACDMIDLDKFLAGKGGEVGHLPVGYPFR